MNFNIKSRGLLDVFFCDFCTTFTKEYCFSSGSADSNATVFFWIDLLLWDTWVLTWNIHSQIFLVSTNHVFHGTHSNFLLGLWCNGGISVLNFCSQYFTKGEFSVLKWWSYRMKVDAYFTKGCTLFCRWVRTGKRSGGSCQQSKGWIAANGRAGICALRR